MMYQSGTARQGAPSQPAYVALALAVAAFLLGGGARADIMSLLVLRPLSALALVYALWKYGGQFLQEKWLAWLVGAIVLLPLLHLIPLPPSLWTALPGRTLVADMFAAAGVGLPWQPISMVPAATLNALLSLMLPVAALLLCFSLGRVQQTGMLWLFIGIGMVSGLLGLLQAIGPQNSILYLYRITNNDMAVGLFANRNHQAIFLACLLPLLAAHVSLVNGRREVILFHKTLASAAALFLIPLILVTGSRNGMILVIFSIPAAYWIYRAPTPVGRNIELSSVRKLSFAAYAAVGTALIALLAFASFRSPAFQRLFADDLAADLRWTAFPTLMRVIGDMFPVGSGVGSFVEVYKVYEPDKLLSPNYFNHAHNDYVELLLTGGLPALLILGFAAFLLIAAGKKAVRPDAKLAASHKDLILLRTGVAVLVLLAIASVGDYPLRTPSLAVFAAVAIAWIVAALRRVYDNGLRP